MPSSMSLFIFNLVCVCENVHIHVLMVCVCADQKMTFRAALCVYMVLMTLSRNFRQCDLVLSNMTEYALVLLNT